MEEEVLYLRQMRVCCKTDHTWIQKDEAESAMSNNGFPAGMVIRLAHKYYEYIENSDGQYFKTYPGFARFLAMNDLLDLDKCAEFLKNTPKDEWEERKEL